MSANEAHLDSNGTTVTDAVIESFANTPDERLRNSLIVLTRHLHAAIREIRPTGEEFTAALELLASAAQQCDADGQEVALLSYVLGVTALVHDLNSGSTPLGATETTLEGPFHVVEPPPREHGASLNIADGDDYCLVTGRVLSTDGRLLPGAEIDVWQANEEGLYDVQRPESQPGDGRGLFTADDEGRFWFRTVLPGHYPIPTEGLAGELLRTTHRHPYRPAHLHMRVVAEGHRPVTTHIFIAGSPYLDSDSVFAVKSSLIHSFDVVDDPSAAERHNLPNPYRHGHIDLMLQPA